MRVKWGGQGSRALFAELDVRMNPGNRRLNRGPAVTDTSLEFHDRESFETWLRTQPHEVAEVLAMRAALRALPRFLGAVVGKHQESYLINLIPILRSMVATWEISVISTRYIVENFNTLLNMANEAVLLDTRALALASPFRASAAAYFAACFTFSITGADTVQPVWDLFFAEGREVVGNIKLKELAARPLWMFGITENTEIQNRLWEEMKRNLLARDEDWQVWTTWWEARRDGLPPDEERELARLTLPEEMWAEGAKTIEGVKAVNAEIARRLAEIDEKRERLRKNLEIGEPPAAPGPTEGPDAVVVPPGEPIHPPAPAARFCTRGQIVDVIPFVPTTGTLPQEAYDYHRDAAALGAELARRLAGSNAPDRLTASVAAANQILGGTITEILPDRLRRLSRKLSADALTYSHPQAEWEVVPDAVAELLELSGLVEDLQHFFPTAISANAAAIRQLGLTSEKAATLREVNDRIEAVVEVAEGVVTERVVDTFVVDRILSGDETAPVDVESEGERALVSANFINTLARSLNRDEPAAVAVPEDWEPPRPEPLPMPDAGGATDGPGGKEPTGKNQTRPRRKRSSTEAKPLTTWTEVAEETVRLVKAKAPSKVADAVVEAVTKTIKSAPVSLPALSATLWAVAVGNPVLMAVPGVGVSLAWIGYALWKRYSRRPPEA